jgi:hypothetical protein
VNVLKQWQSTSISRETRESLAQLSSSINEALREHRIEDARIHAERMHTLSQNHMGFHSYGHFLSAKVCFLAGEKRPTLRHLYLSIMAPYGTIRRRLKTP